MLCYACTDIVNGTSRLLAIPIRHARLHPFFWHHYRAALIEDAAEAGCAICGLLWTKFTDAEKELVRNTRNVPVWSWNPLKWLKFLKRPAFSWYGWSPDEFEIVFQFGYYALKQIEISLIPTHSEFEMTAMARQGHAFSPRYPGQDSRSVAPFEELLFSTTEKMDSERNWNLIQIWNKLCDSTNPEHCECYQQHTLATSDIPTRLLDVVAGPSGQDVRLSLHSAERLALPYLTLSYSWGPDSNHKNRPLLRKTSLESFARQIPFETLPRLFQDAVQVTRRLNHRYLWIDAFCILQDDDEDWLRETARMGDIYQNAILNLAAGGASGGDSHLFCDRNLRTALPLRLGIDWRQMKKWGADPWTNLFNPAGELFHVFDKDFMQENWLNSPLNRRAWVLQERVLSPRILHFGKNFLFWKCRHSELCEIFPVVIPKAIPHVDEPVTRDRFRDLSNAYTWLRTIFTYSDCGISRETDKLVAIGGLARRYGVEAGNSDQYLAGHWRSNLVTSLLWFVANGKKWNGTRCERQPKYVAPSWSWASVAGRISHEMDGDDFYSLKGDQKLAVDILSAHVVSVDPTNPYGRIQDGHIRFLGSLTSGDRFFWCSSLFIPQALRIDNACLAVSGFRWMGLKCVFDDLNDLNSRRSNMFPIPLLFRVTGVYFLPLIRWSREHWLNEIQGLVVARIANTREYRRVGHFWAFASDKAEMTGLNIERSEIILV